MKDEKEIIEEYIKKQEEIRIKEYEKQKNEDLIERGLYQEIYSDEFIEGYTYDYELKKYKCKIPIEVSDEDYQRIKQYPINYSKRSNFSIALYIVGILIIISGFIISIVSNINDALILIGIWISSFIVGSIYFALGYIISILNEKE